MIIKNFLLYPAIFIASILGIVSCNNVETSGSEIKSESKHSANDVHIEYIAHSSFILNHNETSILLDPYADSTWISYLFPKDLTADAIFSTHPHYDHDGGIFRGMKPYWKDKIPFYQDPGRHNIGSFSMTGLKGKHCEPYGKEFGQRNTIWIFDVAGIRIVHWGDNETINDTLASALVNVDILMLPIDDEYHILKKEELEDIISKVDPKIIIPMHYKIAELESDPERPKDLGTIENYMKGKKYVVYLQGNKYTVSKKSLPKSMHYVIFKHSPKVKLPEV